MNIKIHNEYQDEIFNVLVDNLRQFNFKKMGEERSQPLMVIIRNDNDEIVGGIAGRTIYHQFLIEVLWVHDDKRGLGLGIQLMEIAELEAKKRGCIAAQVDTLSFQAPRFYEKMGFQIVGNVSGVKGSPDRYFLLKHYHGE
ncbi:GNAT family N-acetyltransferase [Aeromonas allosaccharophila]|uniref:GNAT family N-acetyltransferase n=1 Tax=Aeromonas allosaccharophila TaxID=656 RepID=UPI001BCE1DA6|nr:GNAT family N-acetyltransferase [Aeromonas allosaccharophila]MBS4695028.1 GNAT family N-acetyltransferase [Aeromonas allosaccharophila]